MLSTDNDSCQKVCNFLYLYLQSQPDGADLIPLTQEEIAAVTGLTRVQIARVMSYLQEDGIIDNARKKVRVRDWDKLKKCCLSLVQY